LGEAENYRPYWNSEWSTKMPDWIAEENKDWAGNYKVKYWTDEWKKILFGSRDSYIDTIMRLGFDGLFLDVIDAYDYFENK
jgi:cysteinyl-tRNA synthetase